MSLDKIRLTKVLVESLFAEAVARLEAGNRQPSDDRLIDACKAWLGERSTVRDRTAINIAAQKRLKAKLAKAKADGYYDAHRADVVPQPVKAKRASLL